MTYQMVLWATAGLWSVHLGARLALRPEKWSWSAWLGVPAFGLAIAGSFLGLAVFGWRGMLSPVQVWELQLSVWAGAMVFLGLRFGIGAIMRITDKDGE